MRFLRVLRDETHEVNGGMIEILDPAIQIHGSFGQQIEFPVRGFHAADVRSSFRSRLAFVPVRVISVSLQATRAVSSLCRLAAAA
jgi:hypothetical protein